MKVIIVLLTAGLIVWYFGFASEDAIFKDYSQGSGSFAGYELCSDNSRSNPYQKGTEAFKGFEWSKSNSYSSCIGDIEFRSGCEKQRELFRAFQECAREKRQ